MRQPEHAAQAIDAFEAGRLKRSEQKQDPRAHEDIDRWPDEPRVNQLAPCSVIDYLHHLLDADVDVPLLPPGSGRTRKNAATAPGLRAVA